MKTTVLLVSDHPIVREKLQTLLRQHPELELAGGVSRQTARRFLQYKSVDVVVLDTQLPAINGIRLADSMKGTTDSPPVILLSLHTDPRYVKASFESGVAGYLIRESAYEELPEAIRIVADGNCYLSPHIVETLPAGFVDGICRLTVE